MSVQSQSDISFLSQLYIQDAPNAVLMAEYPSSNSEETKFQNRSRFIIHDPYPPPRRELLKVLGPHHLMCGWGRSISVSSEFPPPSQLTDHWERILGKQACPSWKPFDYDDHFITLFPHEAIADDHQVVDPTVNYALHSKKVIQEIDCPQADVFESVQLPCIVKLSHGYAGLGNFHLKNTDEEADMRRQLSAHWPAATLVVNSIIEDIQDDFGIQFYVARDGSIVWLGVTRQHFSMGSRWCGGSFSADLQDQMRNESSGIVESVGQHLHSAGYFGLVGIDILRNHLGQQFLVDVNPRLTGITPFLMASRSFVKQGQREGIYRASTRFEGSIVELIALADATSDARVLVLSAFEESQNSSTICHLSASSDSQQKCVDVLNRFGKPPV